MSANNNQVTVLTKKPTFKQRFIASAVIGSTALVMSSAHAEGSFDAIGADFLAEIGGVKTIIVGVFAAALGLIAIFAGYKKFKQGANTA